METTNYFGKQLAIEEYQIINKIKENILKMFSSGGFIFAKNDIKEIKLYHDLDINTGIVIVKEKNKYTAYIHKTVANNTTKDILKSCFMQIKTPEEVLNSEKLHLKRVISFYDGEIPKEKIEEYNNPRVQNFIAYLEASLKDPSSSNKENKAIKNILDEHYKTMEIEKKFPTTNLEIMSSADLCAFLFEYFFKNGIGDDLTLQEKENIKEISVKTTSYYHKEILKLKTLMNKSYKAIKNKSYTSFKKSIKFNDSDNRIWYQGELLFISSQSIILIYEKTDNKNFKIHLINNEYEHQETAFKTWFKNYKKGNISEWDLAFDFKNCECVYANNNCLESVTLDIEFAYEELCRKKLV